MTMAPLKRILYVEDEPDIQMVTKIALETLGGFMVETCNSGEEALEKITDFNPQLVLLDVMMPGMGGQATFHALRTMPATSKMPIIFMTAKIMVNEMESYRAMGAMGIISKPFDPATLHGRLQDLWVEHQKRLEDSEVTTTTLAGSYVVRLKSLVVEIPRLISLLEKDSQNASLVSKIHEIAHNYAGSGGIFGFPAISEAGEKVEEATLAAKQHPATQDGQSIKMSLLTLQEKCLEVISHV